MKRPFFRRPREPRARPLTDEQIRERLAERGDLPDAVDREWFRVERSETRRRTP
jgi:hypothetical protein